MQVWLTNATKKRLIEELRKALYEHPRYRADSQNVQNKFAFRERPQRGVIVNGTSADRVRLSADNYVGRISSFVMQAQVQNFPGTSVEWVMENKSLLEEYSPDRTVFPSPPGVYIIEVSKVPDEARSVPGEFFIDPLLTVSNELLIVLGPQGSQEAQLSRQDVYDRSVRLWFEGRRSLLPGVDFSVDYSTGLVTFLKPVPSGSSVYADYRYAVPRQGPHYFTYDSADYKSIPGAVIAFGDRAQECDKIAVVVSETRSETADVYGGKFEVNFDLVVFSRDPEDRERLVDYVVMKVLERQNPLGYDGMELLDVAPGGETEEVYVAEIDDYFYDGSVNCSFRVDWEIYVPLPVEVFRAETTSAPAEAKHGFLDGSYPADLLRVLASRGELEGVALLGGSGRRMTFERIR